MTTVDRRRTGKYSECDDAVTWRRDSQSSHIEMKVLDKMKESNQSMFYFMSVHIR